MNTFLSFFLIMIYTAYSQQCGNTHSQSTLLSISINGPSVNKIGVTPYLNIINSAADTILPTNPTVAIRTFGGITINSMSVGPGTLELQPLASITYATVSSAISSMTGFDNNLGNVVSAAMIDAISILSNASGQKYHVIFSAGNPLANGFGSTTNPINRNDPCSQAIAAKKANIQTYVVLIGKQGVNFVKEHYSCLVDDPSQDIIIIDPTSTAAGLAQLSSKLCKTNGYDIKITEVNPVDGGSSGYYEFIEIFNRGATATVRGCWETGNTHCSSSVTLGTGQYFIAHSGTDNGSGSTNPGSADQNQSDLPPNPSGSVVYHPLFLQPFEFCEIAEFIDIKGTLLDSNSSRF